MQDDDIPVLTNVLSSARQPSSQSFPVSSDMVAKIAAEIKPQLVLEIEAAITPKIRERLNETLIGESANIQKANQAYLSSAINQLYEKKNALVEQKLTDMQNTIDANISGRVDSGISALEQKTNVALLAHLNDEIEATRQTLTQTIDVTLSERVAASVKEAQQAIMTDTASFVDKRKADLATELPAMMHANADIVKQDLVKEIELMQQKTTADINTKVNAMLPEMERTVMARLEEKLADFEGNAVDSMTKALTAQMADLQVTMFAEHQTNLQTELSGVYNDLTSQTKATLDAHVVRLQAESETSLQNKLAETFPSLYEGLSNNLLASLEKDISATSEQAKQAYKEQVNADLPAVEDVIGHKVSAILEASMPKIEAEISNKVRSEVETLVESVRLVFNQPS